MTPIRVRPILNYYVAFFKTREMASDKVYTPLPPPPTVHQLDPRGNASLSETEQTMYDGVLAHFAAEDPVYTMPGIEKGELQDHEKFWLSRECILR